MYHVSYKCTETAYNVAIHSISFPKLAQETAHNYQHLSLFILVICAPYK